MPRVSMRRSFVVLVFLAALLILISTLHQQQSKLQPETKHTTQSADEELVVQKYSSEDAIKENVDETVYYVNEIEELKTTSAAPVRVIELPWFIKDDGYRPLPTNETMTLDIWPGPSSGDRIVKQLMIPDDSPSNNSTSMNLKKIYLSEGIGSWGLKRGQEIFLKQKCPVDRCSYTDDRKDEETSDAIMFKNPFMPGNNFQRPANQVWIIYMLESPYHTPHFTKNFLVNWTATYRADSDIVAPYEKWVYYDENVHRRPVAFNYAANKTKKVAWFVSNCGAKNKRLEYARSLQEHIQVDIYGACGTMRCPRFTGDCSDMLTKDYKFYLAFENSNCKDYITEKLFVTGLGNNVLPIVMGAPKEDYLSHTPEHSFIHVDDFASPKDLADFLLLLDRNDTLYNEYFEWKGTGQFINTFFSCRLCAMLHQVRPEDPPRTYADLDDWWRGGSTCIKESWRDLVNRTI